MYYPIEKYSFYTAGNKVIAVSTYAGKTVRGIATCSENDTFDLEKGKRLAAAKCALKVADRRMSRAHQKMKEAENIAIQAEEHLNRMTDYFYDSRRAYKDAEDEVKYLLEEF